MLSVSAMLNGCNVANYSLMLTLLLSLNPVHTGRESQVVLDLCGSVQQSERIVTPSRIKCPSSCSLPHLQYERCNPPHPSFH